MKMDGQEEMSEDIKFLARGPLIQARRFSAYNVNGFKFRTISRDQGLKTQNSGVFVAAGTHCVASAADANGEYAILPYYGKLVDIVELNYYGRFMVTFFKCKWADTTTDRGIRIDPFHFTSVNFSRLIHTGESVDDEPYIFASEAQPVYYIDDETIKIGVLLFL